jgi:large subunit ribosomal protein L29
MPKASELAELDDEELDTRLAEYRRELLNLRFQLATGQLDNVSRLAQVRKDVARVLTVIRQRELEEFRETEAEERKAPRKRVVLPAMTTLRPSREEREQEADLALADEGTHAGGGMEDMEDIEEDGIDEDGLDEDGAEDHADGDEEDGT